MSGRARGRGWWRPLRSVVLTVLVVLLAGSVVVWVRSYYATDAWSYRHSKSLPDGRVSVRMVEAWSGKGSLVLRCERWQFYSHREPMGRAFKWYRHSRFDAFQGLAEHEPVKLPLGFGYARDFAGPPIVAIIVPFWAIVLALALPAGWLGRRTYVQSRRRRLGLCARCGYDLRASEGKCPECGDDIPFSLNAVQVATTRQFLA